jgi:hypothetical protein
MGQAAGTAAALAAAGGVPGELPATRLRAQLERDGVLLEPVLPTGHGVAS